MLKVAILDDYQNAFQQLVEVDKYKGKFDFKVFNEPFSDEKEAIVELENFEDESEVSETTVENNSEEIEKKPEKKIKRESFLDKLTKNLQDFLDNAE